MFSKIVIIRNEEDDFKKEKNESHGNAEDGFFIDGSIEKEMIGVCSNLAIATSFGTAVNMQILPAGYKFSDFVKIGRPLLLISIVVITVSSVLFLFWVLERGRHKKRRFENLPCASIRD